MLFREGGKIQIKLILRGLDYSFLNIIFIWIEDYALKCS